MGLEYRYETLLKVYEQFNRDFAKQVAAGMRAESTKQKYLIVYNYLKEFLEKRYKLSDIALKEIAPAFINDFELFLRTDKESLSELSERKTNAKKSKPTSLCLCRKS